MRRRAASRKFSALRAQRGAGRERNARRSWGPGDLLAHNLYYVERYKKRRRAKGHAPRCYSGHTRSGGGAGASEGGQRKA